VIKHIVTVTVNLNQNLPIFGGGGKEAAKMTMSVCFHSESWSTVLVLYW